MGSNISITADCVGRSETQELPSFQLPAFPTLLLHFCKITILYRRLTGATTQHMAPKTQYLLRFIGKKGTGMTAGPRYKV